MKIGPRSLDLDTQASKGFTLQQLHGLGMGPLAGDAHLRAKQSVLPVCRHHFLPAHSPSVPSFLESSSHHTPSAPIGMWGRREYSVYMCGVWYSMCVVCVCVCVCVCCVVCGRVWCVCGTVYVWCVCGLCG